MRLRSRFFPLFSSALLIWSLLPGAFAQQKVEMQNRDLRVLAVVPMIGSGSRLDPRRPMFIADPEAAPNGIIGYQFEISDDGQYALVEFVAKSPEALEPILKSERPDVVAFQKGKHPREDIEREFRKFKKSFDADKFEGKK